MKKSILLMFILISNLTYSQTRELQQSIDSFRTVLNQQSVHIKQLQTQVRRLNAIVNTMKNDLNAVPELSKVENQQQNTADSTFVATKVKTRIHKVSSKSLTKQPMQITNPITSAKVKELIRKSRLIRISGDRRYYRDKFNRMFFVDKSNRAFYVR